jgi:hypothetical protein
MQRTYAIFFLDMEAFSANNILVEKRTRRFQVSSKRESTTPRWATSTPADYGDVPGGFQGYSMEMWAPDGDTVQYLILTRDEYLAAKCTVARMRGHELPAAGRKPSAELSDCRGRGSAGRRHVSPGS